MSTTTLITLHICDNILDALYLKNEIQRVTAISVMIDREKGRVKLSVNRCNYMKANVIVQNKLELLPSQKVI
ncbi:hypothetical protein [Wenyingzhuangia sp. IMCC45574]